MEEDILSAEQINALTKAASDKGTEAETAGLAAGGLSDEQAQTVKDTLNHAMADAVTLLTSSLGAQVEISVNEVIQASEDAVSGLLPAPYTIANFSFSKGFSGDLALIFSEGDAKALGEAVSKGEAGGEAGTGEPTAVLEDLFNQVMASAAESLAGVFNEEVAFEPGSIASDDGSGLGVLTQEAVQANLSFKVEGLMDTHAICLMPLATAMQMAGETGEEEAVEAEEDEVPAFGDESVDLGEAMHDLEEKEGVIGQPAEFAALAPSEKPGEAQNIDLLLDVSLPIVIELGRTSMKIQDILELGPGSVVELDKLAGEPVDIIVNDKQIAKGEVVVVEENFGVRITNLVSPLERIRNLR